MHFYPEYRKAVYPWMEALEASKLSLIMDSRSSRSWNRWYRVNYFTRGHTALIYPQNNMSTAYQWRVVLPTGMSHTGVCKTILEAQAVADDLLVKDGWKLLTEKLINLL